MRAICRCTGRVTHGSFVRFWWLLSLEAVTLPIACAASCQTLQTSKDGSKSVNEIQRITGQDLSSSLFVRVTALVDQSQTAVASQVNSAQTLLYWEIGRLIDADILQRKRGEEAHQAITSLGQQLASRFGGGFSTASLHQMVKFAQAFPDRDAVTSLVSQLSWSHFKTIVPVRTPEARAFYLEQAISARLSVRALRDLIGRQGFERKEIANAQTPGGSTVPSDSFRDPYFLDFLGLKDAYVEKDLEDAIVREMEAFLLEVGNGWAFVARQKRMTIGKDDLYLDLLFYSRPLRRLVAVELKVGRFKAAHEGQMKLYLKWLDRYERQKGEEPPIGLILCTETSREQVELLEMHKDGIVVAEYWTALPPKAELQARIQQIYQSATERVARRDAGADPE